MEEEKDFDRLWKTVEQAVQVYHKEGKRKLTLALDRVPASQCRQRKQVVDRIKDDLSQCKKKDGTPQFQNVSHAQEVEREEDNVTMKSIIYILKLEWN